MDLDIGAWENSRGERVNILYIDNEYEVLKGVRQPMYYGKIVDDPGSVLIGYSPDGHQKTPEHTNNSYRLVKPWVDKPKTKKAWINLYFNTGTNVVSTQNLWPSRDLAQRLGSHMGSSALFLKTVKIGIPYDTMYTEPSSGA
jgi:hypothetical protein